MPTKIGFQVISCTGEDDNYRAAELNYHGPTVRGWRSAFNCTFPQEIVLRLEVLAVLHQVQILVHQYLIPQKIEIYTNQRSDAEILPSNSSPDQFNYLGFITFSDNKATGFRSRELKSILIPSEKAKYIKLKIYNNHINNKNVFNQVGLIGINILGNEIGEKNQEHEFNNNAYRPTTLIPSNTICNSRYTSPYDDLAFEMYVDEKTATIIRSLEWKKQQAILEEDFEQANLLKLTLEDLRAAGEILGLYEQEKKRAIQEEDFDQAKLKKLQIENFRQNVYTVLNVDYLLQSFDNETSTLAQRNGNINKEDILKSLRNVSTTNDSELQEKFLQNIKSPGKNFTHRNIPRHHLIHSKSQTSFSHQKELISGSCLNNHNFSSSKSYPQIYESIRDSEEENLHSNVQPDENPELESNSTSSSAPSNSSDSEESAIFTTSDGFKRQTESFSKSLDGIQEKTEEHIIPSWNETHKSTIPRNTRGRSNNYEASRVRSKSVTTSVTKSTFDEYEDRLVPALKSYNGNEIVRECQMAFAQQSKTILNEKERKQAALSISIFGIEMVEKFYSKNFNDKEEGLKDLQQELRRMVTSAQETNQKSIGCTNKAARAAVFLLHRALRDKVYSVYSGAAETIRMFFTEFVPDRVSSSEIARCVEKLLPELLTKSGDVTPRIHNMAAHTLLSMAESDEVRRLNIIPPQLSRPLMSSVHPRLALSRLEMVEQLILNHGISKDKRSGMTCRMLAEFGSSGLHHPAEAVRKVSERILLLVYKVNPRIVRKQLPPDDNVTRRNLLYRQLFQEFDFMDMQNKISQQDSNNDQAFIERECSPERKTILTKNIEDSFNEKKKSYNSDPQQRKHIIYLNLREKNTMKSSFSSNSGKSPTKSNMLPNKTRIGPAPKVEFNLEENSNSLPKNKKTSEDNEKNKDKLEQDFRSINMNKKESDVPKIKFPSLIDSIESTKARMLFNTQISKRTENLLPKNQAKVSTVNNERHDSQTKKEIKKNFSSGIPLPKCGSTRKHYSSDPKKSYEKKEPENKPMLKNKLRNTEGGNTIESAEEKKLKEMVAFKKEMLETLKRSNEIFTSETFSPCLNKKPEKTIYRSPEKSNRFSESMLASIRENELPVHPLHNGLDRTHGTLKTCIFCLSSGKWPNDDSLNDHYMRDCLMLTMCEYCTEIIEISAFKNHLLDECNQRHLFKECPKCQQAVLEDLLDNHECLDLGKQPSPTRCPFCHTSIGDDDSCWREHLVNNMCSNHPRQIK